MTSPPRPPQSTGHTAPIDGNGRHNGVADVLAIAQQYVASGLSILPIKCDGSKEPACKEWRTFQSRLPTDEEISRHFGSRRVGIAILGGKVSGNLECLDIDSPELVAPFEAIVSEAAPGLLDRLSTIETPREGGGRHYWYRVLDLTIPGNTKLAETEPMPALNEDGTPDIDGTGKQRSRTQTLIETRGEGGYALVPGCPIGCHRSRRPYRHIRGPDLTNVGCITAEERELLFQIARSFNRNVPDYQPSKEEFETVSRIGLSPGDDFKQRATWAEILEPEGWKHGPLRGDVQCWTRPGKTRGVSATTGLKSSYGNELFCVFSSNAYPFEIPAGKTCGTFSKFAAYTFLNHRGDFNEAAKALAEQGYGDRLPPRTSTLHQNLLEIDVGCKDLAVVTKQSWAAIEATNAPEGIFRYGGFASRIEEGDTGEPVIRTLDFHRMRYELARRAMWFEWRKRGEEFVKAPCTPPKDVVNDVLATPDMPLPVLSRIVEAPVFGADGTLQTEPGYHVGNRTLYIPTEGFSVPAVSDQPTQAEVEEARGLICLDMLGDFPFTGVPEMTHALALVLLPFARDLISGPTPLHLIEKPTPGTGATLFVDVAMFPAIGRPVSAMTEGRDEDEWRKRITAKLRSGAPFVFIDNLRRCLDSAAVSSAITSPTWEDRVLGASEMIRIPVRSVWIATGNNPAVSSEIARRTIRIRIDAKQDRPWLRIAFRHLDLRSWVNKNRGKLVWAALTLIRAWLAAGKPQGEKTLGMFEHWAKIMGGILNVAGIPGFLENLNEFYDESDTEGTAWRIFVAEWWAEYGENEVNVSKLYGLISETVSLPLGDKGEQSQKIRLGKLLVDMRDRTFDIDIDGQTARLRVTRGGRKQKTVTWKLIKMTRSMGSV